MTLDEQLLSVVGRQWVWSDVVVVLGLAAVLLAVGPLEVAGPACLLIALVTQQQRLSKRLNATARLFERIQSRRAGL